MGLDHEKTEKISKQFVRRNVTSHTPSLVQVQLVHGEIFLEEPNSMSNPLTRHCVTSSRQ